MIDFTLIINIALGVVAGLLMRNVLYYVFWGLWDTFDRSNNLTEEELERIIK